MKDNQPTLRQDIEDLFAPQQARPGHGVPPNDFQAAQTTNSGHGRLEVRSIQTSTLLNDYADWPHLQQVFKLDRQVSYLKSGRAFAETVYPAPAGRGGVTSLDPQRAPPARLLQLVRSHWGIENGLHYRRDKTLREDATRMTKGNTGHVMAIINNLVIGLALKQGCTYLPTARRFFNANFDATLSAVGL